MERQERQYSCGPAAIRAALYMLGRKVTEAKVRKVAGTTTGGSDEKDMIRAIHYYGYNVTEINSTTKKESWAKIKYQIGRGRPIILCINGWSHWVCIVGMFGKKVILFDPYKEPGKQKSYSGLKAMNEKEVLDMWGYKNEEEEIPLSFYGIVIRN
jgi:ABC-type bacteriocin/lantibiotic exporter with double-glycine peptidase domain